MEKNTILFDRGREEYCFFYIYIAVGSLNEKEDEKGLAHFVEHMNMCFQKYGFFREDCQYRAYAVTDYYSTSYIIGLPQSQRKQGSIFIRKILSGEYIKEEFLEEVRKDILLEKQEKDKSIEDRLLEELLKNTIYDNHKPVGPLKLVQRYRITEIRDFFKKWYKKENIKIGYMTKSKNKIRVLGKNKLQIQKNPVLYKWREKIVTIEKEGKRVRITYKIFIDKYKNILNNNITIYEFVLDMTGELIEEYLKTKYLLRGYSETKLLSSVEDLWWIDMEKNERITWDIIIKEFPEWLQRHWKKIIEQYKILLEDYEKIIDETYILQKIKEEWIYERKFIKIEKQKEEIKKFLSLSNNLQICMEFVNMLFKEEKIIIYY